MFKHTFPINDKVGHLEYPIGLTVDEYPQLELYVQTALKGLRMKLGIGDKKNKGKK